ncbi:MAG TPA: copper homeostasis protein CutC [Paracoccus sp. (in: a-proteobacteria)]|nr:copper homeostasis protein CutC [Paracoccus sp. (in: a-proteobacteria)]
MAIALEICVDDAEGIRTAVATGVDQIELCAALALGGLTPPPGLMRQAAGCGLPVHAMIRPRPGDFLFSADDLQAALDDIRAVRAAGLAGVVIGASRHDGRLDAEALARQAEAAGDNMRVTLHRAFDVAPDADEALETAIALGIDRIMTAGHAPTAAAGAAELSHLMRIAGGRVAIMAGGGIEPSDAAVLVAAGVDELHAACRVLRPAAGPLGSLQIAAGRPVTDGAAIARLQAAIRAAEADRLVAELGKQD